MKLPTVPVSQRLGHVAIVKEVIMLRIARNVLFVMIVGRKDTEQRTVQPEKPRRNENPFIPTKMSKQRRTDDGAARITRMGQQYYQLKED